MKTEPNQDHIENLGEYVVARIENEIKQEDDVDIHWHPDSKANKIVEFFTGGLGVEDAKLITQGP